MNPTADCPVPLKTVDLVAAKKQQLAEDLEEQLVQTLTIGRVVHYTLTADDAAAINTRRADYKAFEASHDHPHLPGQPPATGHVAHVGNHAEEGQVFPATVVRVFSPETTCANLQVYLDGNDVFWATCRPEGEGSGRWVLPTRV